MKEKIDSELIDEGLKGSKTNKEKEMEKEVQEFF